MNQPHSKSLPYLSIAVDAIIWTVVILIVFLFTKWLEGWNILSILALWLLPIVLMAWQVFHHKA